MEGSERTVGQVVLDPDHDTERGDLSHPRPDARDSRLG